MYLETDKEKQSYLYDGFNKESLDNYLQLVKENAPLKERNKALDKLVNERLEAEERFRQLQKQQEELEDKQLQAFDEESFIKSLEGKSKDELENIQGDLWKKGKDKNSDIPFPVIARMSNLVMWIQDKIPQAAFNNDELREAIKSLRSTKEYKDDINSIQYFKENREFIEQTLNIKPIKEFGTNYAEHYHSGESAIQKLISEAQAHKESGAKGEYKGQVAGAFHRDDIGDITLAWGEKGTGKSDGWGLSKIVEYHPEVLDKLDKLMQDLPIVKETENRYKLDNGNFFISIRKDFEGQKQNWVLTALERDESIARRRTDLPSSQSEAEKTASANADDIIPQDSIKAQRSKEYLQKQTAQTLKDELKAADNTQKVAIVTRELEKQNEVLLKQYKELQDIVKNKDYTSLEIQEALDYIATNKKFETDTSIVVYNPIDSKDRGVYITKAAPQDERAKQFLKWKYTHLEQKPLMDIIKKNKSDISKLKWDLEFIKNESNKMRLEKNLARLEKSLLKEEQEYLKSLSLTYDLNTQEGLQKTKDLFYRAKPTQEQIELFESILPVAKKLGVEVRNAIRDPYQVGGNTKNKSGTYFLKENSARVKHSISQADKSETLLHELIHSVTSRAMYAKEKGATNLLNKEQIQAIDNIESIYKQIVEKKDELGFKSWNAREKTGDYGLKNSHEMIAELSNPKFANKLKKANVFEKIIDNIIQLFVSTAEMIGLKKSNAYDKLRENVKNIIENYKDNFSQEYEKLGVRNVGLELFAGEKALEMKLMHHTKQD